MSPFVATKDPVTGKTVLKETVPTATAKSATAPEPTDASAEPVIPGVPAAKAAPSYEEWRVTNPEPDAISKPFEWDQWESARYELFPQWTPQWDAAPTPAPAPAPEVTGGPMPGGTETAASGATQQ